MPKSKNLAKAKAGVGKSTKSVSVPVNTKSIKVPSGTGHGSNKNVPRTGS
jgi:hypothetical protein